MKYIFVCKVNRKISDTEYEVIVNSKDIHALPEENPTLRKVISSNVLPLGLIYVYNAEFDPTLKTVTVLNFGVINLLDNTTENIIPTITPAFSEKIRLAIQEASSYPIDLFKI